MLVMWLPASPEGASRCRGFCSSHLVVLQPHDLLDGLDLSVATDLHCTGIPHIQQLSPADTHCVLASALQTCHPLCASHDGKAPQYVTRQCPGHALWSPGPAQMPLHPKGKVASTVVCLRQLAV